MSHNHFQNSCSLSFGGLIARGPRVRDVIDVGSSGVEGGCTIGAGGCRCGVEGNKRFEVVERARSSDEEIFGEGGSGGGEKVVGGVGSNREVYDAFWSRRKYKFGVGDTGDGWSPRRVSWG